MISHNRKVGDFSRMRKTRHWLALWSAVAAVSACGDTSTEPVSTSEPITHQTVVVDASGVSADALALLLPFDETAGRTAADISGLGHDGTLTKLGVFFDPSGGQINGAVLLDGADGLIVVGDSPYLNLETVRTRSISVWFNASTPDLTDHKQVLWEEGGSSKGLILYLHGGRLYVAAWNGDKTLGWNGTFLWADGVTAGVWHHVTLVLDGGDALIADALRGYLNGVLFATGPGARVAAHGDIGIGRNYRSVRFHDGSSTGMHGFAGSLDDMRIYNRVLTSEEIQILAGATPGNRTPTANAGSDVRVEPGIAATLDGTASADPDEGPEPLSFLWEQISGPIVTITNPTAAVASVTPADAGSYVFRLTVTDGDLQAADEVTVYSGNQAPIAAAGSDTTGSPGRTMTLDGSQSTDPDAGPEPLSYTWEQVLGPPATLVETSGALASYSATEAGTLVFRLTVGDGQAVSSDDVTVTLSNSLPVAMVGADISVPPGAVVALDGSASSDPDGWPQPVTYLWEQVSGTPVSILNATSAVAEVVLQEVDAYAFRLTVGDGEAQSTDELSVNVIAADPGTAAVVHGTSVSGLATTSGEWDTKNQRRSWWNSYRQRWDAVLPVASPPGSVTSAWWITLGVDAFAPVYDTEFDDGSGVRPDVFWDDAGGMLYVLGAARSGTFFQSYRYDAAADEYVLQVGRTPVDGTAAIDRATIYMTPNGYLWTSSMTAKDGGGLWVNRSTNGGATWDGAVNLLMPNANGQTSLTHFMHEGSAYIAVGAAEDGAVSNSQFRFLMLDQNDAMWASPSAWRDESSLIPPFQSGEHADDEISIISDADGNVYIAAETEPGGTGTQPQLVLYKRTSAGAWSQVTVRYRDSDVAARKRPTVAIDGATNTLYIFSIDQHRKAVSHVSAPLSDLQQLAANPMITAIEESGKQFRNNITPRFPTSLESGLLVLIDNITDDTIWRRRVVH